MIRQAHRIVLASFAVGLLAAVCVLVVQTGTTRITPDSFGWRLVFRGSNDPLRGHAVLLLPGVDRREPRRIDFVAESLESHAELGIAVDRKTIGSLDLTSQGRVPFMLPASPSPGARLDLVVDAPVRLLRIDVTGKREFPFISPALAFVLSGGLSLFLARRLNARFALSLGSALGALLTAAHTRVLAFMSLPNQPIRALATLVPLFLAVALMSLTPRRERRCCCIGMLVLAAAFFGAWVRGVFLPTAGSWDTEYWKAWTARAVSAGLTRVYGDAGSVPAGRFWAQFHGREARFEIDYQGRAFPVDYPPLAIAAWVLSDRFVERCVTGLDSAEKRNTAVKLPAVVGDMASLIAILCTLRRRPKHAVAFASLYWALPVSWLPSAVLGYSDAVYAPLLVIALATAAMGAPFLSGALLATACLIKPTAGVVAPAVFLALARRSGAWWRATLAVIVVGITALLPYLVSGTLPTTIIHLYRILHQRTLSGGFPNVWWLVGHFLTQTHETDLLGPVRYASVDLVPDARLLGLLLFIPAAAVALWRSRRLDAVESALFAGALLVFGYSLLGVGVHENHPHALFLILIATGLTTLTQRVLFVGTSLTYLLAMLSLSGFGRFYGNRFLAFDPFFSNVPRIRMATGIDATLLLALLNIALFVYALAHFNGVSKRGSGLSARQIAKTY